MGIIVALTELYYVVGWDLPDDSGARAWAPHLLGPPLIALFFGLPLAVGVAVGWAWRGAAVIGAAVGVLIGSIVVTCLGDPVTRAIDPRSISMAEGTEGSPHARCPRLVRVDDRSADGRPDRLGGWRCEQTEMTPLVSRPTIRR